ncbi:hypothetical protein HYE54_00005, partial [Aggregatibacter actinomycetemcomitans]|nr:hypothetical protein [Aggregatibacter actinomycetemcomitans]
LFEQICEQFELEGYEQVELSGPGGSIILNREGITLVGDVYIEGELVMEEEEVEGVSLFDTSINETLTPTTYYSTRLDVYDIYGRCNEKKIPYTILDSQGEVVTGGILDEDGRTARVYRETREQLKFYIGKARIES